MTDTLKQLICSATGATGAVERETLQQLWSGYGYIKRYVLEGSAWPSIIVKHIQPPMQAQHPRGWNSSIGHQRKVRSYAVETHFYQAYARDSAARLPGCIASERHGEELVILLEDLDAAGYSGRKASVTWAQLATCLEWLARFHASFLGRAPEGLWPVGTYWHLATRPDELSVLEDHSLRAAAPLIDAMLSGCTYRTFVHGDAKLANFCFSDRGEVAGLDFQYVGGGCGMKDVAYFVGSCLDERECERLEGRILETYFTALHHALGTSNRELEAEWRTLYPVAWADFYRFLKGWSPGHWKLNTYSERLTQAVIEQL